MTSDSDLYFTTTPPRCREVYVAAGRCELIEGHDGMHKCGPMSWGVLKTLGMVTIPLKSEP